DREASQLKLQYTRVIAPDDGVVTARTVVVGQIAQAGGEMLRLLRQNRVEWRAEVPEGRMRDVKVGQDARVTTADGTQLVGKVRSVAPTVQSGTRTGLVYVDLPKSENARPGMFARGEIETSRSSGATLPLASVIVRDGYSYVFVVNEKQGVERRRIETGTVRGGRVEGKWGGKSPAPRAVRGVVLFVGLSLPGSVGFKKLGIQDRPDLDIPTVTVTVNYPGVPPSQLETEVTRKIEDSVASATGIDHIRSTVTEGLSQTTIKFQLESNTSEAVDDVRDAFPRIRSNLPAEIEEPII